MNFTRLIVNSDCHRIITVETCSINCQFLTTVGVSFASTDRLDCRQYLHRVASDSVEQTIHDLIGVIGGPACAGEIGSNIALLSSLLSLNLAMNIVNFVPI